MSRIAIAATEKSAANAPGLSDPQLRARAEAACEWLMEIGTPEALDGAARLIAALDAIDAPWEDVEPSLGWCEVGCTPSGHLNIVTYSQAHLGDGYSPDDREDEHDGSEPQNYYNRISDASPWEQQRWAQPQDWKRGAA